MIARHQVVIYVLAVLALSSAIAAAAHAAGNTQLAILSVFTPSLTALVLACLTQGRRGARALFIDQLLKPVGWRWLLVAIALFPAAGWLAAAIYAQLGGPAVGLRSTQLLPQAVVILVISLGEEFGWRGYLLPLLQQKYSALTASLVLGVVWGLWHFPASLIGTGVPADMPFTVFMAWVIIATVLFTWVYNNTGSVLTAILLHSTANASFNYLAILPEFTGTMTPFYLFLGIVTTAAALVLLRFGSARLVR